MKEIVLYAEYKVRREDLTNLSPVRFALARFGLYLNRGTVQTYTQCYSELKAHAHGAGDYEEMKGMAKGFADMLQQQYPGIKTIRVYSREEGTLYEEAK